MGVGGVWKLIALLLLRFAPDPGEKFHVYVDMGPFWGQVKRVYGGKNNMDFLTTLGYRQMRELMGMLAKFNVRVTWVFDGPQDKFESGKVSLWGSVTGMQPACRAGHARPPARSHLHPHPNPPRLAVDGQSL